MADTGTTAPPPAKPAAPAADPKVGEVPAAGAAPAAAAEPTEDYVISGKVVKLTKAQAKAYVQKGFFADKQLRSVDALQKGTAGLLADLKTPEGWVKLLKNPALGANPQAVIAKLLESDIIDEETAEKFEKWVYDKRVRPSKLTPEQLDQEKKLSEYEKLKAEKEAREKNDATAAEKAKIQQIHAAVRSEVGKQIEADKTFPKTEGAVRSVIEKLRVMNKKGAPLTVENIGKALQQVKKDHILHQQALFDAVGEDPEALISIFGEARALRISRALVARHKLKGAKKPAAPAEPEGEARREKTTEAIDRKLGRTAHGYRIMDI